jgi:hypothetical protein
MTTATFYQDKVTAGHDIVGLVLTMVIIYQDKVTAGHDIVTVCPDQGDNQSETG